MGTQGKEPAYLVHEVAGRIRLRLPSIKGDLRRAVWLRGKLRDDAAIRMTRPNTVTGSLLIQYEGGQRARERILLRLEDLGWRLDARAMMPTPLPQSRSVGLLPELTGALAGAAASYAMRRAARGLIAAFL